MPIKYAHLYSTTTGNQPGDLEPGEVALNIEDEIIFLGDGTSFYKNTSGVSVASATANKGWKGLNFAALWTIKTITSDTIAIAGDKKTLYRSSGTTNITLTIPTNTLTVGSEIRLSREDSGTFSIDLTGHTLNGGVAANLTNYTLRVGEELRLVYEAVNAFKVTIDPNYEISEQLYNFRTAWTVTLAATANHVIIPAATYSGLVAIGQEADGLGGLSCTELPGAVGTGSVALVNDAEGYPYGLCQVRNAASKNFQTVTDADGTYLVWGFQQAANGKADNSNAAGDIQVSFAYHKAGTWTLADIDPKDLEFGFSFVVPAGWIPHTIA